MANHIENYIRVENANEDVLNEIKRVFQIEEGDYQVHTEDLAKRVFGEDAPQEYDRGWYCDECGAKWLNGCIEDDDLDEIRILMTSAWDPINGWVERFAQNLRNIKEDVVVYNTFEDEGYNFAGVYYTSKEYDDCEWVDIDEYDIEKIWEDDDVREQYHDELRDILDGHRESHKTTIEDNQQND
jgi:hypothetical protein